MSDNTTEQLPSAFWRGLEQFNQGEYYACHDTLEAIWMEAPDPPKSLYQGILQVAVGIYHLSNRNWQGAVILLGEGINRIRRYDSGYAGVDIDDLLEQSSDLLRGLQMAGPERAAVCAYHLGLLPEDTVAASLDSAEPLDEELKLQLKVPKIRYQRDEGL